MKITVGQGTDIARRFSYRRVDARILTENVVFAWKKKIRSISQALDAGIKNAKLWHLKSKNGIYRQSPVKSPDIKTA